MKKQILTLVFAIFSIGAMAQTVNDVPIEKIENRYIEIVGIQKGLFKRTVKIHIDFGQRNRAFTNKDVKVLDKDGKTMEFNSMMDVLNFFSNYGYKLADSYGLTMGNSNVLHYVMEKEK